MHHIIFELKKEEIQDKCNFENLKLGIVQFVIVYLHEKVNSIFPSTHGCYILLHGEISHFYNDRRISRPLYEKWVQRMDKM